MFGMNNDEYIGLTCEALCDGLETLLNEYERSDSHYYLVWSTGRYGEGQHSVREDIAVVILNAISLLKYQHKQIEHLKEQEAKTGYWIDSAGNDKCSICGAEYSDLYPDYGNTHFCPNCGAKMKGQ